MKRFTVVILILMSVSVARSIRAQDPGSPVLSPYRDSEPPSDLSSEFTAATAAGYEPQFHGQRTGHPIAGLHLVRQWRWFSGGYEFGWLQPRFAQNVSVVVQRPSGTEARAFDHSFDMSARVWVGVENARCNGIRASFWQFDGAAPNQVTFATAGATPLSLTIFGAAGNLNRTATANIGDAMTSDHELEMRTIDLEATHRYRFSCTEVLASLGLRYGKTHQRMHAVATNGAGFLTELVCQDLYFEGLGPTLGAQFTRRLFTCHPVLCGFSCFANTRASMLFGTQEQEIVLVTAGGAGLAEDEHVQNDFLPIGELVGGLQYAARPFGRGLWTVRTGYRAECWFGAGGPVDSDSNLALHGMLLSLSAQW
jgi:hypothetical protein